VEEEGVGVEVTEIEITPGASDLERTEGAEIDALKANSPGIVADPDEWLEEEIKRSVFLTSMDWAIDWARRSALWTTICFPACCAFEFIATAASRFDISRFGMEIIRASPRQADLMITAGTLTWKMAPQVKRIYDQMAEPKWVIAMGACACSGGIFRSSYSVVPGYNHILPIDVYVPGCPPRPEGLLQGIQQLQKKIAKEHVDIKIPSFKEARGMIRK
jgi:NADH-quinone oxidoreductase subunit B